MRFEVLPGLPAYGPMAVNFSARGEREHREGLVVRFYPTQSEPWVGNFVGGKSGYAAIMDHPNKSDVIVIADGEASVVDPDTRIIRYRIATDVREVIPVPSPECIVFRSLTNFVAVRADHSGWHTARISWDDFRNLKIRGTELVGEAYTPIEDAWVPFHVDLLTGQCADGVYEREMARAVPILPRQIDAE